MLKNYLENVRNTVPLVHNITNYVTVNDVANAIPVIAIGGIGKNNVRELRGTGICGIAVISALFASGDIEKAAEEMKAMTEDAVSDKWSRYQ